MLTGQNWIRPPDGNWHRSVAQANSGTVIVWDLQTLWADILCYTGQVKSKHWHQLEVYSAGGGGASKLPSYTSFAILKYDKIVGLYIFKKNLKCLIRLFSNCQPGTNRQQILQDALQDLSMNPPESKSREKVLGSTVRTHLPWQERMFYLFVFLYSILC